MNKRSLLLLSAVLAVIAGTCVLNLKSKLGRASSLLVCQVVPTGLPPEVLRRYCQICANDLEERCQGLVQLPNIPSSEMAAFLPLLSEVLTTDDYVRREGGRRFSLAELAAEDIAILGGMDAVPVLIKSLQSQKSTEIQAGLSGVRRLMDVLTRGPDAKTNEMVIAAIKLVPCVHLLSTNCAQETRDEAMAFFGSISFRAQSIESELRRFLPSASSKE